MNLFACKPWGIVLVYYLTNTRNMSIFNADGLNMFPQNLCLCFSVVFLFTVCTWMYRRVFTFAFAITKPSLSRKQLVGIHGTGLLTLTCTTKNSNLHVNTVILPLPSHNVKWRTQSINIKIPICLTQKSCHFWWRLSQCPGKIGESQHPQRKNISSSHARWGPYQLQIGDYNPYK